MILSPLRYPGGKNKIAPFFADLCANNSATEHYIEPYSGGASVALFLLMNKFVDEITINDKDRSIFAFWYNILFETEQFINDIEKIELNVENWKYFKQIQKEKESIDLFTLGLSTFILNRTNRSGIIKAGVIGGVKQAGDYKMDCRFNREDLISRIKSISNFKNQINLFNLDAIELIDKIEPIANKNTILYFDPPYYNKAKSLYMNHYSLEDHQNVSDRIKLIKNMKWVVSYDNVDEIKSLYKEFRYNDFTFKHTAYESRVGKEIMFFSDNLILPNEQDWDPTEYKYKNKKLLKHFKS